MNTDSSNFISYFFFFLLTLAAEILGTVGGFGSSLFFVSFSQFLFDFQSVLALTGLLHIFSNTSKLILFWKHINWKLVLWLGVSSILLAITGAYLTTIINLRYAKLLLGIFLIAFSAFFYFYPRFNLKPTTKNSVLGGGLAGFLAGFIGTGGAVRGLVLASFNLEKNLFVGTSAAIDFGVDLSRTLIYFENQYFGRELWIYIPLLVVASFAGSYFGKLILIKMSQDNFRKFLLILVFIMGVMLLVTKAT